MFIVYYIRWMCFMSLCIDMAGIYLFTGKKAKAHSSIPQKRIWLILISRKVPKELIKNEKWDWMLLGWTSTRTVLYMSSWDSFFFLSNFSMIWSKHHGSTKAEFIFSAAFTLREKWIGREKKKRLGLFYAWRYSVHSEYNFTQRLTVWCIRKVSANGGFYCTKPIILEFIYSSSCNIKKFQSGKLNI